MPEWLMIGTAAMGGGVATVAAQWLKGLTDRHKTDRTVDAQLEEQRGKLMFDLLRQAREEVKAARAEAAHLRPLVPRLAHFEEALDHLHAVLASDTDETRTAAERRARAFLRRMRGADEKGELRNQVQTEISAERIKHDAERGEGPPAE